MRLIATVAAVALLVVAGLAHASAPPLLQRSVDAAAAAAAAAACGAHNPQQCAAQMANQGECRWCPVRLGGQGECVPQSQKCQCARMASADDCMSHSIFSNCIWCPASDQGGRCVEGGGDDVCQCAVMSRESCELSQQCRACPVENKQFLCVPRSTQCQCSRIQSINSCIASGERSGGACAWCPYNADGNSTRGVCGESSRLCDCTQMGIGSCTGYPYCRYCPTATGGKCQPLSQQC